MNVDFETLQEEIAAFEEMSEAEVMDFYQVDYKEEARRFIEDWWSMIS
ncbi:MAG: hypothetical protein LBV74_02410 [Tannerella sp.]|jgi:hypothetical protein|nr:hypothetical protein [Tannerella sp.]